MSASPLLTSATSVSLSGVWSSEPALDLIPLSQFSVAVRALGALDRGDDRPEVGLTRSQLELAPVLRAGQIQHRPGHLRGADLARVVDHHAEPAGDTNPVAVGRAVPRRHVGQRRADDLRQQATLIELLQPVRVLREEDVRRRTAALLLDLGGQHRLVVALDPNLDPGPLGERLDQRSRSSPRAGRCRASASGLHQPGRRTRASPTSCSSPRNRPARQPRRSREHRPRRPAPRAAPGKTGPPATG